VPRIPVAVVTGASRGLGRQIALTLAGCGYAIGVNYRSGENEAEETVRLIGDRSLPLKADVRNFRQTEKMAEEVSARWGRLDALINNAGITRDGLLMGYRERDFDDTLDVNLKGCFNTVKAFVPLMTESGGGHIINISSYSGLRGSAGQSAYSASKAAVIGFTLSAARELSCHNIRVNAILPGYMETEMGRRAEEAMEKAGKESMLNRLSDPDEVARFIACFLTTKNITGQVLSLESRICS